MDIIGAFLPEKFDREKSRHFQHQFDYRPPAVNPGGCSQVFENIPLKIVFYIIFNKISK